MAVKVRRNETVLRSYDWLLLRLLNAVFLRIFYASFLSLLILVLVCLFVCCLLYSSRFVYSVGRTNYMRHNRVESSRFELKRTNDFAIIICLLVFAFLHINININWYRNCYFDRFGLQNKNGSLNLSLCVCWAALWHTHTHEHRSPCGLMRRYLACIWLSSHMCS